jgi:hypothetical protein
MIRELIERLKTWARETTAALKERLATAVRPIKPIPPVVACARAIVVASGTGCSTTWEERAENRELEKNEVLRDAKKDGLKKKQETTRAVIPCKSLFFEF